MQQLTANISGSVRTEYLHGKEYRVVPLSMIVEGVLNGNKGPLFYPNSEIQATVNAWNNMPITLYHPTDGTKAISARSPAVLQRQQLGYVFNARFTDKLVAEGWLDVAKCGELDDRIISNVDAGIPMELSTGLTTVNKPAEEGATHNGVPYEQIATNYAPDHLAILPDQLGACSLADGCGVLVNSASDKEDNKCLIHVENNEWLVENQMSHSDLRDALEKELRSKSTQDEPNVWISEVFDSFIVYWSGDDLLRLSYTKSDGSVLLSSDAPQRVIRETVFKTVTNTEEIPDMADKALVDEVIANVDIWGEDDKETLSKLPDEKLKSIVENAKEAKKDKEVVKAAKTGLENFTFNEATGQWVEKKPEEPVTNCGCGKANCGSSETQNKELSVEEYLQQAPAAVRSAITNSMAIEAREKETLMEQIVGHLPEEQKALAINSYKDKSLDELQVLAMTVNAAVVVKSKSKPALDPIPQPNYFAPAVASVETQNQSSTFEPLPPPGIEYGNG